MTDLRTGATNLFLPTLETETGPRGKFLEAIRKAAAGEFEILGELGRRADGDIAYLAQDLSQPRLVALRLERESDSKHDYVLNVLQELDGSLPATGAGCIRCSEPLRGWGRFCPNCGYDLSGLDTSGITASGEEIKRLAEELLGQECRVLGRMRRGQGAGTVLFAKPTGKETIVGLRLRRGEGGGFAMDQASEIDSLCDALGPSDGPGPAGAPEPEDRDGIQLPSHAAPTLLADAGGIPTEEGVGLASTDTPKPAPRFPLTVIILVVAATLAVGIVLGALLSR